MPAALSSASCRIPVAELGLWRADQLAIPSRPACPSGFGALDAELPGGGWPAGSLSELLLRDPGCGEIRLLAPALAALSERDLVWIAPPFPPYAPALQNLQLPLQRLVWLNPASEADAAWAAEQVLRSGSAGAVLWWSREALPTSLRRLHLAAQEGCAPLFALRPWARQHQSSPAPLRLGLEPQAHDTLWVHVFKRRGPQLAQPISLTLPSPVHGRRVALKPPVVADVVAGPVPALVAA